MLLKDFLDTSIDSRDEVIAMFSFVKGFLEETFEHNFKNQNISDLEGIIIKMVTAFSHHGIQESTDLPLLAEELISKVLETKANGKEQWLKDMCTHPYTELNKKLIVCYIQFQNNNNVNQFNKFKPLLMPDLVNKSDAIKFLKEAKRIIKDELNLKDNIKNEIIKYIDKAISILNNSKPHWSLYFGTIKEVLLVLSALVAFGNGIKSLAFSEKLNQSIGNINQAQNIIENTIVNYQVIEGVANFNRNMIINQETPQITSSKDNLNTNEKLNQDKSNDDF